MRALLPRGWTLVIVVVAAAVVALLVVGLSRRDSTPDKCSSMTYEGIVDADRSADETLALFVAEHEEGPIPLTGWTKTAENGDTTTYTSNEQGHWEIVIRHGAVRSYNGCR